MARASFGDRLWLVVAGLALFVLAFFLAGRPVHADDLALTGDEHWVVLAARQDLSEAIDLAKGFDGDGTPRVVLSENGWYAVIVGPYEVHDILQARARLILTEVPPDAYLTHGKSFLATVWSPEQEADMAEANEPGEEAIGSRTIRFGNIEYEFSLPDRFEYLGAGIDEDEDDSLSHVYFKDGDESVTFELGFYDEDDPIRSLKEELGGRFHLDPDKVPADRDYLGTQPERETARGNSLWRLYTSKTGASKRIVYANIACCGRYLVAIIDYPADAAVGTWIEEFYKSFTASGRRVGEDDGPVYDWTLPTTNIPAASDQEYLYDACASLWNDGYAGKADFKAMTAFYVGRQSYCASASGRESLAEAREQANAICRRNGGAQCYAFATGETLSDWAQNQQFAISDGDRERDHENRQNQRVSQPVARDSGGDDGGSFLSDLLGAAPAIINGFNQGAALGRALSGGGYSGSGGGGYSGSGGGGYSGSGGGGYSGSGGGGSGNGCAQLRAIYRQCETSWRNIGGGKTGQAGSFYQCMQTYQSAMTSSGC